MFRCRLGTFAPHGWRLLRSARNEKPGWSATGRRPVSVVAALVWGLVCLSLSRGADPAGPEERLSPAAKVQLWEETFDAAWTIIRDTYFDPSFHGIDWAAVRTELRPKAQAARDVEGLRHVIEQMLERLGGSHMALIPGRVVQALEPKVNLESDDRVADLARNEKAPKPNEAPGPGSPPRETSDRTGPSNGEVGLDFRLIGGQMVVTRLDPDGPAAKAGVRPGWIVEEIAGEPVTTILRELPENLAPRQVPFLSWRLMSSRLSGRPGSRVTLRCRNGPGELIRLDLERQPEPGEATQLGHFPTLYARMETELLPTQKGTAIGVIRFNLWMLSIVQRLDAKIDQFRNAKGIVIDLRGNLGGMGGMILGFSGHFLNERVSLGVLKMRGPELNFFANPRKVSTAGERVEPFAGPVAILIDELTLSASEIFAGGMQALHRARVFGRASGGQALPAIWDRLPNGDVLYHAIGDFITASGERLEGKGVSPDQTIPLTREALLAGRDEALLAAVAWMDETQPERANGAVNR